MAACNSSLLAAEMPVAQLQASNLVVAIVGFQREGTGMDMAGFGVRLISCTAAEVADFIFSFPFYLHGWSDSFPMFYPRNGYLGM